MIPLLNDFLSISELLLKVRSIFLKPEKNTIIVYLSEGHIYSDLDAFKISYTGTGNNILLKYKFDKNVINFTDYQQIMEGPIMINNIQFGSLSYSINIMCTKSDKKYPKLKIEIKF